SEDEDQQDLPLKGAATGALRADGRPAHEESVRAQAKDVVDTPGDVFRKLDQCASTSQYCFGSVQRSKPDRPVVDGLEVACVHGGQAIEVDRSGPSDHRDRTRS